MTYSPLVSVIIIFLNAEKFLEEAIESVFSQTYPAWEMLLVDDGSQDASSILAQQYAEKYPEKVRYLQHEGHQNRDMPASRNLGIRNAKGDYIAFLDSDDVWLPQKLEQQVKILEANPEADMVYGQDQYWFSWTGDPADLERDFTYPLDVPPNAIIYPPQLVPLFLQRLIKVPCPTGILVKKAAVEAVGGFEESFRGKNNIYEDQGFYAKLFLRKAVIVANTCWDRYRQHPDSSCSIAARLGNKRAAREYFLRWLARYYIEQGVTDREIWKALRKELFPYNHPNLDSLLNRIRYRANQVRALVTPTRAINGD